MSLKIRWRRKIEKGYKLSVGKKKTKKTAVYAETELSFLTIHEFSALSETNLSTDEPDPSSTGLSPTPL